MIETSSSLGEPENTLGFTGVPRGGQITSIQLLEHADSVRRAIAPGITLKRKSALGQFMTPAPVARFMASMFPPSTLTKCKLLDAGAGVGALTCAFLDRWAARATTPFQNRFIMACSHNRGMAVSPLRPISGGGSRGLQAPGRRLAIKLALATGFSFILLRCGSRPQKTGPILVPVWRGNAA